MSKKKSIQGKPFSKQGGGYSGPQKPSFGRGAPMSRRPPRQPGR